MSEISDNIVSLIVSKEFHKAKKLIHEAMNNKLGLILEEKLLKYAPTLYEQSEDTDQIEELRFGNPEDRGNVIATLKARGISFSEKDSDYELSKKVKENLPYWVEYDARKKQLDADSAAKDKIDNTIRIALGVGTAASTVGWLAGMYGKEVSTHIKNLAQNTAIAIDQVKKSRQLIPAGEIVVDAIGKKLPAVAAVTSKLTPAFAVVSKVAQKTFAPLATATAVYDVVDNTINDPDWKDKPGTAAATLGVDIVKNAALVAPLYLGPAALPIYGGAVIGTAAAYGVNKGIDSLMGSRPGEGLADYQLQWDTYKAKNIVRGIDAVFSTKSGIEKETQSEVDEFKVQQAQHIQSMKDEDAAARKRTAEFDASDAGIAYHREQDRKWEEYLLRHKKDPEASVSPAAPVVPVGPAIVLSEPVAPGIPKSQRPKTDPIPAGTKRTSSGQVMYETYKAYLRQRLYEDIVDDVGKVVDHVVDKVGGYYNRARSIFGPSPHELILAATKDLMDPRHRSVTDTITNDTSALRYAARDIPGVAAVEKAVAEAGYFPKGGFYDRNNDGEEDFLSLRAHQAKLEKMTPKERAAALRPEVPPFPGSGLKHVGHPGEIPNSDPLPSDTQRA